MFIESLDISGLQDLPTCSLSDIPMEGIRFRQSTPETTALADALSLWFAAFDADELVSWVVQMGWAHEEEIQIVGEDLVEEIGWLDGQLPRFWVEDRDVSIQCRIRLKVEEVQQIRLLIPDPEVQVCIMEYPVITGTVVLRFSNDHHIMAVDRIGFSVGHYVLPIDRISWKTSLFSLFKSRFVRNHQDLLISETALQALLSMEDFEYYESFQRACDLGELRVSTNADGAPVLMLDSKPLRRWGEGVERQIRLLAVNYLYKADIVWSEYMPEQSAERQIWGVDPSSPIDGQTLHSVLDAPIAFRKP